MLKMIMTCLALQVIMIALALKTITRRMTLKIPDQHGLSAIIPDVAKVVGAKGGR